MAYLGTPSLSYAQRLGRAAVRTTDLSDSFREELFPIPRKFIDCGQAQATNKRKDDRNSLLMNPDLPPELHGQDIKQRLGFIEPAKPPRSRSSLKKVLLYDNVSEQRRLEMSLSKLTFEEKRFTESIAQRKAEILNHTAARTDRAEILYYRKRHGRRPMSEPTHSAINNMASSPRRIQGGGIYFQGHRLEASSKPRSAGELMSRNQLANLVKFPSISTGRCRNNLEFPSPFAVEDFSRSKNYFGDVTRKCLADERFCRLREALIPPEEWERRGLEQEG